MKYEEFKEKLSVEVQKVYGKDMKVEIKQVLKNNSQYYDGIYIEKYPGERAVPIINMDHMYERHINEGLELGQCVVHVCRIRDKYGCDDSMAEFIRKLTVWEEVKEHVYPVLMATENNERFLATLVSTPFLDLSVIYRVCEKAGKNGEHSIKISKAMLGEYGITREQLHEQAMKNLKKETYQFVSMDWLANALRSIAAPIDNQWYDVEHLEMYVMTKDALMFGASGILNQELLKGFAGNRNYFVILSCVHEAIFVLDDGKTDKEGLNEMVANTYKNVVDVEEQLSKHYYYYNGETGEIVMDK